MNRTVIKHRASLLKGKEDLLALLNDVHQLKLEETGRRQFYHPFSIKQLNYYCNSCKSSRRYRQFDIKKKSGGTRKITTPRNATFMMMLSALNEILKSLYTPSNYAMGFTEKRSVVSNAELHKVQNYVFNIDLKDFFPSIEQPRIWKRIQLEPFNFKQPVANIIAGLCSVKVYNTMENGEKSVSYVLPQGAPTSPIITNMICDTLDRRLAGLAKRFGLHYSRYADDITFSSMHNVYQINSDFRKELERIITGQHFTINEKKTRLQKKGKKQEVTGIIVNEKLNVSQKYVQDIRNILYIWGKYGYNDAHARFLSKYKAEKGHIKKGIPKLENVVGGKLQYLRMVKGRNDSVYQRLYSKYTSLTSIPIRNARIVDKSFKVLKQEQTNIIEEINKDLDQLLQE